MKVFARATQDAGATAVGQLEFSCSPAGLSIGFLGLSVFSPGYAPGATVTKTSYLVPWSDITMARVGDEDIYLELASPSLPFDRLSLSHFTRGPGVPLTELRQRRLILHLSALGLAGLLVLAATAFGITFGRDSILSSSLTIGATIALLVLAAGYGLDQRYFLRPPSEAEVRDGFVRELVAYYPAVVMGEAAPLDKPLSWPDFTRFLPRTALALGVILGAFVLTAISRGRELFSAESELAKRSGEPARLEERAERTPPRENNAAPMRPTTPSPSREEESSPTPSEPKRDEASASDSTPIHERTCLCDRADSPLWRNPIPRLSTLLLDKRTLTTEKHTKTTIEVAVINNSDEPIKEITLLVEFFEMNGKRLEATKERPLYFEGPLAPGDAIKWKTEARGSSFRIRSPEVGALGASGEGAAPAGAFFELLKAKNRPVRLHAARMLAYLGDSRAEEAALTLKDALRSSEGPYLRRVLSAVSATRVCDVQLDPKTNTLGACIFNAAEEKKKDLGFRVELLQNELDPAQPLAHPPELVAERKWSVEAELPPQSGSYVRVALPKELSPTTGQALEVLAGPLAELE